MRIPIIAGNWKMHTTVDEGVDLARKLCELLDGQSRVEKLLCPPFTHLIALKQALAGSSLRLGAQNAFWEPNGAFTGEVSAAMLSPLVDYVIIGHSERRQYFGESDETVNRRL